MTTMNEWIDVNESTPRRFTEVLVARENGVMCYTHYYNGRSWFGYGQAQPTENITHWMKLPEPPITKIKLS